MFFDVKIVSCSYIHDGSYRYILLRNKFPKKVRNNNVLETGKRNKMYLIGEAGGLGEHVKVSGGEGQGHWLVHLNSHSLLLLKTQIHNR